jgi:hypothetical protein
LIDSCNDLRSAIARYTAFDLFFSQEGISSVQPGFTGTTARAVAVHGSSVPTHSVSVPDSIWGKKEKKKKVALACYLVCCFRFIILQYVSI